MQAGWPVGFEKKGNLRISTIGRRTGRRHDVTTWFAVDDNRLFVATEDTRRDWVKNKMKILPLKTDSERQHVNDLYSKKYLLARLGRLLRPKGFAHYGAFELLPQ
jgi:hypothetical protein